MLKNEPTLTIGGVDTAKSEPPKIHYRFEKILYRYYRYCPD